MGDNPLFAREEPCGIRRELKLMVCGEARRVPAGLALTRAASAREVKAEVNIIFERKC